MHTYMYSLHLTNPRCSLRPAIPLVATCSYVVCVDICVCVLVPYMQGANQNAVSASGGSVVGERLGSGSEVVSPTSTLHGHGGASEMREITV